MPPTRRYAGPRRPGEMSAKVTKSRKTFKYKTGTKRAGARGAKSNMNVTRLSTLSRKEENVSISFREQLDFSNMGGEAGSSPCVIRADLMNPVVGGPGSSGNDVIVSNVVNLKANSTNPVLTRQSYNNKRNLSDRLEDYFNEYRKAIVTSSEVTFNVRPKLNQVTAESNADSISIVPYPVDISTGLDPAGTSGLRGPQTATRWVAANATGDLYVWCILQQSQQQLYNQTDGVAPLSTLKQGIPGMRMQKLNVTPNNQRGCTFKLKYTPNKVFGLKDWKDNKQLLSVLNSATQPTTLKTAYAYLGVGSSINGVDPGDPAITQGAKFLANCIVEVSVKYNINFSERINIDGNNEPIPHAGEL